MCPCLMADGYYFRQCTYCLKEFSSLCCVHSLQQMECPHCLTKPYPILDPTGLRPSDLLKRGWIKVVGARYSSGPLRACPANHALAGSYSLDGAIWAIACNDGRLRDKLTKALCDCIKQSVSSTVLHGTRAYNDYFLETQQQAVDIMLKAEAMVYDTTT